jgi:hypothetical protein
MPSATTLVEPPAVTWSKSTLPPNVRFLNRQTVKPRANQPRAGLVIEPTGRRSCGAFSSHVSPTFAARSGTSGLSPAPLKQLRKIQGARDFRWWGRCGRCGTLHRQSGDLFAENPVIELAPRRSTHRTLKTDWPRPVIPSRAVFLATLKGRLNGGHQRVREFSGRSAWTGT